ncbi:MAG: HesB/IscA family protein [Myxococcota bacterium]
MLSITEDAARQAVQMMKDNDIDPTSGSGLRVGIKSGGCSGLNYVLDIVEGPEDNDRVFNQHGVKLYCDPKSYLYLNGTQIDYENSMMESGFRFTNPNAKRSCGCGTSFAV